MISYVLSVDGVTVGSAQNVAVIKAVALTVDSTSTPTSVNQPRKIVAELTFDGRASAAVSSVLTRTATTAVLRLASDPALAPTFLDLSIVFRSPKFRSVRHTATPGGETLIVLRVEALALEVRLQQPKLPTAISSFVIG